MKVVVLMVAEFIAWLKVAVTVVEILTPMAPFMGETEVIVGAAATMVMLKALVAVCAGVPASVTRTVKLKVPAAVGVPEMTPLPLSVNPVGSVPLAIDQVYGNVPPFATRVAE